MTNLLSHQIVKLSLWKVFVDVLNAMPDALNPPGMDLEKFIQYVQIVVDAIN